MILEWFPVARAILILKSVDLFLPKNILGKLLVQVFYTNCEQPNHILCT